jgi:hypothetical protein
VTSFLMGLEPNSSSSAASLDDEDSSSSAFNRGRRGRESPPRSSYRDPNTSRSPMPPRSPNRERWTDGRSERAISPNSTRSGRPVGSSASSVVSSNWRSSMSTTSTNASSSAFTRYSNSSVRSVSTANTSVSSNSWRTNGKYASSSTSSYHAAHPGLPKNVKIMDGVPWELNELPRGQRLDPPGDSANVPPRKQRSRKPKELSLGTISERPPHSANNQRSPGYIGRDARASNGDLNSALSSSSSQGEGDGPKKVQKGQINALAKMLSALRR